MKLEENARKAQERDLQAHVDSIMSILRGITEMSAYNQNDLTMGNIIQTELITLGLPVEFAKVEA